MVSSSPMCRCLHCHRDGVVGLVAMASLPLLMHRRLAVVNNDGDNTMGDNNGNDCDGTTDNKLDDDDGDGATDDDIDKNFDGATGDNDDDKDDNATEDIVNNDGNSEDEQQCQQ